MELNKGERLMVNPTQILASKLGLLFSILLLTLYVAPLGAAQQVTPAISVTVNKSMVFRLAQRAKRVSVSQPEVADVVVVAPNQLLINGKAVGTTSLIVFDEKGEVDNYDLIVTPDVGALRTQLRTVFPNEKVEISTSGPAIVLRGEVSNEVVYDKVLEIVQTYLPPKPPAAVAPVTNITAAAPARATISSSGTGFAGGGQIAFDDTTSLSAIDRFGGRIIEGVVDLLVIREMRMIELDVIVAEVSMRKARELGINFDALIRHGSRVSAFSSDLVLPGPANAAVSLISDRYELSTILRLLQNKNVGEILAQPRLVMKNGRSGGFLAGGEFPVVQTLQNSFSVEFKPFGVRLDFVPTITWSDRIDLRVFPEVSDIDPATTVNGIPGLSVRRTLSRVEMKEGESLVMSGLLDRRIFKELNKFPLLGDIPILGALFRSTEFSNRESELVFVITPRIVTTMKPGEKPRLPQLEKYDDPDIRQIPLPGSSRERKPSAPGATIP
ncbi:MAG TPA: pilus assembly protein N-terminal domain-containing protein [Candidatus Binatia bacterium]|nr:pilus assembly protein N-terminal domain-containing protein [Candidatus Binatia bacterium]